MKRKILPWLGPPVILGLFVAGVTRLATAQPRPPGPTSMRTSAGQDPFAGLTGAQKLAAIATLQARGQAHEEAWLKDFVQRGRDPRLLPRQPLEAFYAAPLPDLQSAIAGTEVIVVGTVRSVRFEAGPVTYLTFAVERTLKGAPGSEVTIRKMGGPVPTSMEVGSTGVFLYAENSHVLLKGDRAVLFLQRTGPAGSYHIQGSTGSYRIEGGQVSAVDLNPFRASIKGQSEQTFISNVMNVVKN